MLTFATRLREAGITFVPKMKTFLKILTLFIAIGAIGGAVRLCALSNIFFVLGVVEVVCAVVCLKKAL